MATAVTKKKAPGAYVTQRYGILNPWGDVWTPETFESIAEAEQHVSNFYARMTKKPDLRKFKVARVEVTVRAL